MATSAIAQQTPRENRSFRMCAACSAHPSARARCPDRLGDRSSGATKTSSGAPSASRRPWGRPPAWEGIMSWIDLNSAKAATPTRVAHAQRRPDWARHEGLLAGTPPSDAHRHAIRCAIANRCARSLVAGLTIWMGLGGASWASQADLVVVGPVVTMATSRPHARGLAVAGGKIVFVGDAASARKLLRPGGRLIALEREQTVIPGLVDTHNHMMDAGLMRQRCALDMPGGACGGAKNKASALEKIAAYSKNHPDLEWVIGSGWSGDWDWVNRDLG